MEKLQKEVQVFIQSRTVCFCLTNWKEQHSNQCRVRGGIPSGDTHSQKEPDEDKTCPTKYVKNM